MDYSKMPLAPSERIKTVVISSRSGGADHYVEVHRSLADGLAGRSGTTYVTCTCVAGRNYWGNLQRGVYTQGCHAMKYVRRTLEVRAPSPKASYRWPFASR